MIIAVFLLVAIGLWLVLCARHIVGWLEAIAMNTKYICGALENLSTKQKESDEILSLLKDINGHLHWIRIVPERTERERWARLDSYRNSEHE